MAKDQTKAAASVGDRIASALNSDKTTAAQVTALLEEAEAEAGKLNESAAWWRDQALDPRASGAEVAERRRKADDAQFEADRITRAVETLEQLEVELGQKEAAAARRAAYDAAQKQRDAVARRIREEYPALAEQLVALIDEISASNEAVDRVNRRLPEGAAPLALAESLARGLGDLIELAPLPSGVDVSERPRAPVRPPFDPPMITQMMVPAPDARLEALRPPGWMNRPILGREPGLPVPANARNW